MSLNQNTKPICGLSAMPVIVVAKLIRKDHWICGGQQDTACYLS